MKSLRKLYKSYVLFLFRPDNWVIYDPPKEEEPLLSMLPDHVNTDVSPSAEIPKPIRENIWLSLAKIKRKLTTESTIDKSEDAESNVVPVTSEPTDKETVTMTTTFERGTTESQNEKTSNLNLGL